MKEKLVKLIPEFNFIEDNSLREKVIRVWIKAMNQGGWNIDDLQTIPFTLLLENCPFSIVEHTRGVVNTAIGTEKVFCEIYKGKVKLNRDYLIAGALLHDVGKLVEYAGKNGKFVKSDAGKSLRHPFSGVGLCYDEGIPHEIMHMIATHAKEGDMGKRTPESVVINHADFANFEILH